MTAELGTWAVGRTLIRDGSASVHRCTDVNDPTRHAVVKVLWRADPELRARLHREFELLQTLDHPCLLSVVELELEEALPYLVYEDMDAISLADRIVEGPIPLARILSWARSLVDVLAYMHERGVHHRDVRPATVLVHEGGVVLADFGLAKDAHAPDPGITVHGSRIGDVSASPPEWIGSKPLPGDVVDRYGLGVLIATVCLGRSPYVGDDGEPEHMAAARIMRQKRESPFLDLPTEFPEGLRSIVRDLTAVKPRERETSLRRIAERLEQIEAPQHTIRVEPRTEAQTSGFRFASSVGFVIVSAFVLVLAVLILLAGARLVL